MPKMRSRNKKAGIRLNIHRKFRIGTRKSGMSGLQMSTEDLKAALADPNQKRYIGNIKAVLEKRGITVDT